MGFLNKRNRQPPVVLLLLALITSLLGRTIKESQKLKTITRYTSIGILILGILAFMKGNSTLIYLLNGKIPSDRHQIVSFLSMIPELLAFLGLLTTLRMFQNKHFIKITYYFGFAFLCVPFIIIVYQAVETITQMDKLFFSSNTTRQSLDISQDPIKQHMLEKAGRILSSLRVAAYGLLLFLGFKITAVKYSEECITASDCGDLSSKK